MRKIKKEKSRKTWKVETEKSNKKVKQKNKTLKTERCRREKQKIIGLNWSWGKQKSEAEQHRKDK